MAKGRLIAGILTSRQVIWDAAETSQLRASLRLAHATAGGTPVELLKHVHRFALTQSHSHNGLF